MNNYLMACFAVGVIVCSLKAGSPPMPTAPPAREAPSPPNEPLRYQKSFVLTMNFAGRIPDDIGANIVGPDDGDELQPPGSKWQNRPDLIYQARISYSYVHRLNHVPPKKNEFPSKIPPSCPSVLYLPDNVPQGTILPVIGFLYKVDRNTGPKLSMSWVPERDLPEGAKPVQRDSLFLPNGGFSTFWLRDGGNPSRLVATKFEVREKHGVKQILATVKYSDDSKADQLVEVREGDVLVLPIEGAFVVRSIVMPDKKTKVVGWVELSSKPIPEADLEKEKRTIVRIKKPK